MKVINPLASITTLDGASSYVMSHRSKNQPLVVWVFDHGRSHPWISDLKDWDPNRVDHPWIAKSARGDLVTQATDPKRDWYVIPPSALDNPLMIVKDRDEAKEWIDVPVECWVGGYRPHKNPVRMYINKQRSDRRWFLKDDRGRLVEIGQAQRPLNDRYIYPLDLPCSPENPARQLSKIFLGG